MRVNVTGLFIAACCLLCGCPKDKGHDVTLVRKTDSCLTQVCNATAQTWGAKEIRDSLNRFIGIDRSTLPAHLQRIHMNINSFHNTDNAVYLTLISTDTEHIQAFKKYIFDSPLIKIEGGPGKPPQGILLQDSTLFSMKVIPNIYPTSITQIEISITNHSVREGMAGEDQYIEYYDGTKWIGLPQNNFFTSIGYPIAPGETRDEFVARLLPELRINKPGLYRVYKSVTIGNGKELVEYFIIAPFYLSDNPQEYKEYTHFANNLHEPRQMAEFGEGRGDLIRFFRENLHYPESYKGTGTEVRLFYSFMIDPTGKPEKFVCHPENILYPRDTDQTYEEFREEALRVFRLMPTWKPAVNRIRSPVSVSTGLFFYFKEDRCSVE